MSNRFRIRPLVRCRSWSMRESSCQRGTLVIPHATWSVAPAPFGEGATVLQTEPLDIGPSGVPSRRPGRLALHGTFGLTPFGEDDVWLARCERARAVRRLGDGFDDVGLLARGVQDLSGERFHAAGKPKLGSRTRLELALRPLEILELGELLQKGIGRVTEGLGVAHAVSLAGPPQAAARSRIPSPHPRAGAPRYGRRGARRRACSHSSRCPDR